MPYSHDIRLRMSDTTIYPRRNRKYQALNPEHHSET